MEKTRLFRAVAIAVSMSALAACNDGGSTTPSTSGGRDAGNTASSLIGSAFKGPIDGATVRVLDAAGNILATGGSTNGRFELKDFTMPADDQPVFIETIGGQYKDEATGETVSPGNTGLMTAFTASELRDIIEKGQVLAMTPETTLAAKLARQLMNEGKRPGEALRSARDTVQAELIAGTNPAMGVPGDKLLLIGDLSADLPADQAEALARNRAISFSFEADSLNLKPQQVFELIEARAKDLTDGKLDGKDKDNRVLSITDRNGQSHKLDEIDQKTSYGQARSRLLNHTIERIARGDFTEAEKARLEKLGIDTGYFDDLNEKNAAAKANTDKLLAATDLPAFNHLPVLTDEDGDPSNNAQTYTLTATPNVSVTINAPGERWETPMLRYNGMELPPVIKARRGEFMTLNLDNKLDEETTIHWHGFKIPGDQDGGPDFPVAAGTAKTYSFPMLQPAASLWFHPHPDMKTGKQVYRGLAGVFLLEDEISEQLVAEKKLPGGKYDIPMLVQDRRFADEKNGVRELEYMTQEMDSDGMLGDKVLVNGAILPKLDVETRQYRFRIYNTSNARTYDFALSDGAKFKVVGTDGGLLPEPVETDHIMLGAAERAEIVVDFSRYEVGDKVMLISRPFSGGPMAAMMGMNGGSGMGGSGMGGSGMGGSGMGDSGMGDSGIGGSDMGGSDMGGAGMGGAGGMAPRASDDGMGSDGMQGMGDMAMTPNGAYLDIMRFDITTDATDDVTLYTKLPANADINTQRLTAADASKTRDFVMTMKMGNMGNGGGMGAGSGGGQMGGGMANMTFVINGKSFDINRIDEVIKLAEGNTEIWAIRNMSPMAHPFHAHAIQWQILDRNGKPATGVDLGWKDTVLVQPGETVRFIGRFDPAVNKGDYMYHCHILEHEDAGMMGFFRIE